MEYRDSLVGVRGPCPVKQSPLVELDGWMWFRWALWLWSASASFPGIVAYMVWLEPQGGRAVSRPDRAQPGRSAGPAPADRRCDQADHQGRPGPTQRRSIGSPGGTGARDRLGVFGFGSNAVCDQYGARQPPLGRGLFDRNFQLEPPGIFLALLVGNKYSLLGAMRSVAQLVSYEIPQVLSTIPIVLWAGSLSLVTIFDKQREFKDLFTARSTILLIASIAEVNAAARRSTRLKPSRRSLPAIIPSTGMRFGLFFLAEYLSVFAISCLATALFLGEARRSRSSNSP